MDEPSTHTPFYYTCPEVAARQLRRHVVSVRRAIAAGHLKASRLNGGPYVVSDRALAEYVARYERREA